MAKYIVEETNRSKYEKNFKFPMINLIPAIVWCIPVHQKLSPLAGTMGAFIAVAAFFILYVLLSYVPISIVIRELPCEKDGYSDAQYGWL